MQSFKYRSDTFAKVEVCMSYDGRPDLEKLLTEMGSGLLTSPNSSLTFRISYRT